MIILIFSPYPKVFVALSKFWYDITPIQEFCQNYFYLCFPKLENLELDWSKKISYYAW